MHYLLALWILVKFSQLIAVLVLRVSFSQLIAVLVLRVSHWLLQTLRDSFPEFDDWISNGYYPAIQRFRKTIEGIILLTFILPLIALSLLLHECRYLLWVGLYLRDRHEAANPETHPERLRKLSDGVKPNPLLCRVIARNPNTPSDVLLKLGEKFPKQLFANPIFDL